MSSEAMFHAVRQDTIFDRIGADAWVGYRLVTVHDPCDGTDGDLTNVLDQFERFVRFIDVHYATSESVNRIPVRYKDKRQAREGYRRPRSMHRASTFQQSKFKGEK